MGNFAKPSITQVDTTNPILQEILKDPAGYIQNNGGRNDAANQAAAWMMNAAAPAGSLEHDAFNAMGPMLQAMMSRQQTGTTNPFSEMQFSNQFSEMADPHQGVNAQGQALQLMAAAQPQQQRQLQDAMARLQAAAPGRFSAGFAAEGRDLGTQALQDYNLFANQVMNNALGLEQQNRDSSRNFSLGARGLQQTAAQNTAGNQLQARGMQQGAHFDTANINQQAQQNNAMNMGNFAQIYGQLASNAANGQFNRNLQMGQFGLQQQAGQLNPLLELLGLASPQTPVVNESGLQQLMNFGTQAIGMYQAGKNAFGGDQQGGPGQTYYGGGYNGGGAPVQTPNGPRPFK